MDTGEVKRYYRWIGGLHNGTYEAYLAETEKEIYFESGRMIPKDQFESMLTQIQEEEYNAEMSKKGSQEDQFKKWEEQFGITSEAVQPAPTPSQTTQPPVKEQNPIDLILSKQKKVKKQPWPITIELPIPDGKVLDFLTMMFDEDEVYEAVVNFAFSGITMEDIKAKVKEQLMPESDLNEETEEENTKSDK